MRLWLIAHQVPYPPIHGGRLDMWHRIIALSRQGVCIHLVTWADEDVAEKYLKYMCQYVASVTVYQRKRALPLALHPYYPTTVVSRTLSRAQHQAEISRARGASADLIFLDGLFGAILATSLARELNIPLVYRSHNVEFEYVKALMAAETSPIRKIHLLSNVLRTWAVERRVRNQSSLVYDISAEDQDVWRKNGAVNKAKILSYYLHPDTGYLTVAPGSTPDIDVLYIGNLYSSNNVLGLKWFATNAAPFLEDLRILVAGAKPSPELRSVLESAGVEVIANPEEVSPFYDRARVLINPVWHSSGVNVKMIEMLFTGKPLVATPPATRGLPNRLLKHVSVAEEPAEFANFIRSRLTDVPSCVQQADVIEEHSGKNVTYLIEDLQRVARLR